MQKDGSKSTDHIPMWLMLELTYRCPLQCPYCSNPLNFVKAKKELTTQEWIRVLTEARQLGAVQLGLSGGEPLVRTDLEEIIQAASDLGFYSNLITSSVGMDETRLLKIKEAGINTIQISFQSSNQQQNDFLAQTQCFDHKVAIAKAVKKLGLPLTINIVLHRTNIDALKEHLDFAISLGADYIELANTQYLGFAYNNRNFLLPSIEQVRKAEAIAKEYQERYQVTPKIFFVAADYFENRPTPCMNGWGRTFMAIDPEGTVMPCHSAKILPISLPNARDHSLKWIWEESEAFNHFRGFEWMKEPCRTCPERFKDFGGCRCQAFLLLGDATLTDPVCDLSPNHHIIKEMIAHAGPETPDILFRNARNSKLIATKITIEPDKK